MAGYSNPPNQSKGILDDYAIRKDVATREGTIQKVPVNPKDITNKEYVDSQIPANITLFFTENASDIGTYFDMTPAPSEDALETRVNVVPGSSSGTLIDSFASVVGCGCISGLVQIPRGVFNVHMHCVASALNSLRMYAELYHRNAGGTETLLVTSEDSDLISTTAGHIDFHGSITDILTWESTDRIVLKIYCKNESAAARSITIHLEGDSASRLELPAVRATPTTRDFAVVESYDTGWINRSDWTNVHMGSNTTKNTDSNVTHNLDAVLSDLDVKVYISSDGTDANSFEISNMNNASANLSGQTIFQVDVDNIKVQTGTKGLTYIVDAGIAVLIDIEDWYYKIVVKKFSSGTTSALITRTGTTLSAGTAGDVTDIPRKSYDTGWISRSDWTNVHLGTDDTKNTDSNVTHNLDAPLSDLLIKILISTDGTDGNGFEVGTGDANSGGADYGVVISQEDSNNFIAQTGGSGIVTLTTSGGGSAVDTDDWYYKIKVFKLG